MFQKSFSKIWILVVLVVIVASGVLVYKYFPMPKGELSKINVWKNYINKEYGFSISYPDGVYIQETDYPESKTIRAGFRFSGMPEGYNIYNMGIRVEPDSMEEFIRDDINIELETKIVVNGIKGNRIIGTDEEGYLVDEIWLRKDDRIYIIDNYNEVFNQMLSFFRFL